MAPPPQSPLSPHLGTPKELKARLEAERAGAPFVLYRDRDNRQQIVPLTDDIAVFTVGRGSQCDIRIDWDAEVSGLHVELRRTGGQWLAVDDGLSRNGTFVNDERVVGRRRLFDQDQVRLGHTVLVFRQPQARKTTRTVAAEALPAVALPQSQRRVLVALCRPYRDGAAFAKPPSNQEIADELYLTVAAVKSHLHALFERFGLEELPQNEKRVRLAAMALESGTVTPSELQPG